MVRTAAQARLLWQRRRVQSRRFLLDVSQVRVVADISQLLSQVWYNGHFHWVTPDYWTVAPYELLTFAMPMNDSKVDRTAYQILLHIGITYKMFEVPAQP
jgi:hypothetical protein